MSKKGSFHFVLCMCHRFFRYMYILLLLSRPIQDHVLGVAVHVWLGVLLSDLSARALPPSLPVQAVVHCGPLSMVILWSHFPTLRQCRPILFLFFGPTTWNGLPIDLRHLPNDACSQFRHLLETGIFCFAWVGSASEYGS